MLTDFPPFPVDDATLDLLESAMNPREHGDPDAGSSSVWDVLELYSDLANAGQPGPRYHDHSVIAALITEVRRLRARG